ncbi:5-formyltetrahydrofolate cyclo-ligase [Pseudohongiella spirulinae]|uniref:5-formyltetrahydrofolate cyclo-ligase n=1 Tax=Pseudohongiella spirulinae TaxID=1249552 RepID=A0A0S2KA10_9GAMM|nr:5-formyltetrahydrofolate cyclo-ligase [Pseudohongiella spirulinae]ALO44815.1 5-formyltetrahydrofolate cyclo-ligase [Pseudohongiella spirulinae]
MPVSLRQQLRQQRRQLDYLQQQHAARLLVRRLSRSLRWQRSRRIAFYLPVDGELDPRELLRLALQQGKYCYLPVLHPFHPDRMLFVRYQLTDRLHYNRWGIAEPVPSKARRILPRRLQLAFVPLTGFDRSGNRLGMGKGFYDRAFAFRIGNSRSPVLVGLAHNCQEVAGGLQAAAWDVKMDAICTPSEIIGRI